ncbi:Hypothetical predicted protein, partial [Pelobates cultripes]
PFWKGVHWVVSTLTDNSVKLSPENYLLHLTPLSLATYKKTITLYLINEARSLIPTYWKQATAPSTDDWINRVGDIRNIEDLIMTADGR